MGNAKTSAYVDYQQRASEFGVGDIVYPFASGNPALNGRVQAVYPAIGMVDVEWPHGSERVPVEDLQQYFNQAGDYNPASVGHDNIPGGAEKAPVPAGPLEPVDQKPLDKRGNDYTVVGSVNDFEAKRKRSSADNQVNRVAQAFVKKSVYWAARDRKYKATQEEVDTGNYRCPRCKDVFLRPASYKRESGTSVRLMACSECLFLVKPCDIENHPDNVTMPTAEV